MQSADQYDARLTRAAERVLDTLDRLDEHFEQHFASERRSARHRFRTLVTVRVSNQSKASAGDDSEETFRAWARSISGDGLSFIHPERIKAKKILVGVDMPDGKTAWMHSEVMRTKQVEGEVFFEYGVRFLARF